MQQSQNSWRDETASLNEMNFNRRVGGQVNSSLRENDRGEYNRREYSNDSSMNRNNNQNVNKTIHTIVYSIILKNAVSICRYRIIQINDICSLFVFVFQIKLLTQIHK